MQSLLDYMTRLEVTQGVGLGAPFPHSRLIARQPSGTET